MRQAEAEVNTPQGSFLLLSFHSSVRVCDKSHEAQKHTYKFHNSWYSSLDFRQASPFWSRLVRKSSQRQQAGRLTFWVVVATSRWKPLKVHTSTSPSSCLFGEEAEIIVRAQHVRDWIKWQRQRFKDNQLHSVCNIQHTIYYNVACGVWQVCAMNCILTIWTSPSVQFEVRPRNRNPLRWPFYLLH